MTVPSTKFREDYAGNGSATSFPYAFRIFKNTDLVVIKTDNSGNETTLTLGTDYTVTGAGSYNGGAVVLTTALPTSYRLTIERVLAIRQDTDLRNQGEFLAETHEDAFDRLTMIVQRLAGYLGIGQDGTLRTLLLGTGDVDGAGAFRARGNRISGLGDPVDNADAVGKRWTQEQIASAVNVDGSSMLGVFVITIDTIAGASSLLWPDKAMVFAKGRNDVGDGGGGMFRYSASSTATANGGTVIAPAGGGRLFRELPLGLVAAADFGLTADNADGLRAAMSDADFQTQRRYGSLRHINGVNSANGIVDLANFAGQGLSSNIPIGWVFHHYTDGKLLQIDNVGSGPALTLKNARNPIRRADKPSDYVGDGNYLEILRDDGTGTSVQEAFINKDLDIVWRYRPLKRISGKADTSSWAFQDSTYSQHTYFREVRQAGQQVYYEKDTGSEYAIVLGASRSTLALRADGASSVLKLSAGSGQVVIDTGSVLWGLGNLALNSTGILIDMRKPVQLMKYSTASLPTLGATDRCMAWDTTLDKPVFWTGTQWRTVNFA